MVTTKTLDAMTMRHLLEALTDADALLDMANPNHDKSRAQARGLIRYVHLILSEAAVQAVKVQACSEETTGGAVNG